MYSFLIHQLINIWIVPTLEAILFHSPMDILILYVFVCIFVFCMTYIFLYDYVFILLDIISLGAVLMGCTVSLFVALRQFLIMWWQLTSNSQPYFSLSSVGITSYVPLCPTLYLVFLKNHQIGFPQWLCYFTSLPEVSNSLDINHLLCLLV